MKIALSSLDQAWENKSLNFEKCSKVVELSSKFDADIVVFPEMTLTGFTSNSRLVAEQSQNSESLERFSRLASKDKIAIVAGAVLRSESDKLYNSALAFNRQGLTLTRYDKIHPFSPSGENRHISCGKDLGLFEYEGMRFGMTICYDLRFPVIYSLLSTICDCVINIANWPAKRIEHWKTLLQARAIENQIYIIGVNRTGIDGNGLEYVDSTYVFSPDGSALIPNTIAEGLHIFDIRKSAVTECRSTFPTREDAKWALYKELLNHSNL